MTPSCAEKTALLLTYSDAARDYSDAVTELHESIGTVPSKEYERLHRRTSTLGDRSRLHQDGYGRTRPGPRVVASCSSNGPARASNTPE
jgi:hypothetical protein